jgi:hypothetical protein
LIERYSVEASETYRSLEGERSVASFVRADNDRLPLTERSPFYLSEGETTLAPDRPEGASDSGELNAPFQIFVIWHLHGGTIREEVRLRLPLSTSDNLRPNRPAGNTFRRSFNASVL